jgi:hypothetical protein
MPAKPALPSPEFPSDEEDEPLALIVPSNDVDDYIGQMEEDAGAVDRRVFSAGVEYNYSPEGDLESIFSNDGVFTPPFVDLTAPKQRPMNPAPGRFRRLSFVARCLEREHLPEALALLCYDYYNGPGNWISKSHATAHAKSEFALMEAFYTTRLSAVIDLTADFSDYDTPAPKKRKPSKTLKKANKKQKKPFAIVFKFEGKTQLTHYLL